MIPQNEAVYLDANFIIAYFVSIHEQHIAASKLMASLLVMDNTLCFSPLTIDEALYHIYLNLRESDRFGAFSPLSDFYSLFKAIVEKLLAFKQVKVVQFDNSVRQGIVNAVENIRAYKFQPRDAFHTAYLQDLGIKYIVSHDGKFDDLKAINIKRIDFN
jgi:predicted nucleic acid-binding protein